VDSETRESIARLGEEKTDAGTATGSPDMVEYTLANDC
jgi:hypothetical protein